MKNGDNNKSNEPVSDNGQGKIKGEFFKNRQAALQWLQQRGQVSRSKFYDDCNAGLITVRPDKTLSKFEVALYAEKIFTATRQAAGTGTTAIHRETYEARKIQAEAEIKEMQVEDAKRKLDKQWLHKEFAWLQMAGLIGVLLDSLHNQFQAGQNYLIHLSCGDNSRGPELYEGCKELIARAFNEVLSKSRIEGMFARAEEE